jgi:hypothetical protein
MGDGLPADLAEVDADVEAGNGRVPLADLRPRREVTDAPISDAASPPSVSQGPDSDSGQPGPILSEAPASARATRFN